MNNKNLTLVIAVSIAIGFLIAKSCEKKQIEYITTPAKSGAYKTDKTEYIGLEIPVEVPKWYKDTKTENELKLELAEREHRLEAYKNETNFLIDEFLHADSLSKELLYSKSIELKQFSNVFDDSLITIHNVGTLRGELKDLSTYYLIKPAKVPVKIKDTKFILSVGAGADFNENKPVVKFGAGYQNYRIDYLPNQKIGLISYEIKF